ncbi:MAG TPA: hypothetical protein DCQ28_04460, partial [Bacteroidetes bacterium]|nr:hypothetical protein [Bacteroidota bacterium]
AQMFGKWHIGKNPTPKANSYLILKFDFSGIDTKSYESTENGFLVNVKKGFNNFIHQYNFLFSTKDIEQINNSLSANICATKFFEVLNNPKFKNAIYLLIDE